MFSIKKKRFNKNEMENDLFVTPNKRKLAFQMPSPAQKRYVCAQNILLRKQNQYNLLDDHNFASTSSSNQVDDSDEKLSLTNINQNRMK